MTKSWKIAIALLTFLPCLGCAPSDDAQPSSETTAAPTAGDCDNVENLFQRVECFTTLATETDDPSVCGQSSHEGVKYQCYAVLAERRGSTELCDAIPARSADHQKLRDACISDVAKKTLIPLLCEGIESVGLRDSCFAGIGLETADTALCEKIQDPGLKSMCSGLPVVVDGAECSVSPVVSENLDLAPPGGFVEACSLDTELCSMFSRGYPEGVTTLGYFVLEGQWARYSKTKELGFTVYLIAQSGGSMSAAEFNAVKASIASRGGSMPDRTELPSILEKDGQVSLGVLDQTADSITIGTILKLRTVEMLGGRDVSMAATNVALRVNTHTLSLYVYHVYDGPSDIDRVRALTKQWLRCLRAQNPR